MELLKLENTLEKDKQALDAIDEAIASLKSDKEVYAKIAELKLTKAEVKTDLATLIEYQDDFHICASCPGLKECPKARSGYKMEITRERGRLHQNFFPCDLKVKEDIERNKYVKRDFTEEWVGLDLRKIERSTSTRNPMLKAMALNMKGDSRWLYVYGKEKSGKSFVLACFANSFAEKNPGVAYINTKTVFDELKAQSIDFKGKAKFARNMELLSSVPLLVFDDFGLEYKTAYVFNNILSPLIKKRDEDGLLTAFASPYPLEEALRGYKYKAGKENVEALIEIIKGRTKSAFDITGLPLYK